MPQAAIEATQGQCRRSRRRLAAMTAVILGWLVSAGAQTREPECLFAADASARVEGEDCRPDPLNLAATPHLEAAMAAFGIQPSQVVLIGCAQASFRIGRPNRSPAGLTYRITYPIMANRPLQSYVAPLVHELAHAFQLSEDGSIPGVRARRENSSERVELGADYLSGVVFRRALAEINRGAFQLNSNLIGSYRTDTADLHGSPEERTAAFRTGYYQDSAPADLRVAEQSFQDDSFGRIRAMSR